MGHMSTLQKVQKEFLYADWMYIIAKGQFERIIWIFSKVMQELLEMSGLIPLQEHPSLTTTVLQCVQDHLSLNRTKASTHTSL